MLKAEIKKQAAQLRERFGLDTPPIRVELLSDKLGIAINYIDMSDTEKQLGQKISGAIVTKDKKTRITVNQDHPQTRQNFTIAHELGHFTLHLKDDEDGAIVSFRSLKNDREREADVFAAELLMPGDLVRKEHAAAFYPTVSFLADEFGVSKAAMKIRLDELGLEYIG